MQAGFLPEIKRLTQFSGTYVLQKENGTTGVTISTKDANGAVAADAILFVPVKK